MAFQHVNRRRDTYYLQAGKTRTGKPRYWFGRKLTGEPVERVPEGFEVYEQPEGGIVSLRKIKPTEISPLEREIVTEGIRRHAGLAHFIVDVEADSLVVYLPGMSEDEANRGIAELAGSFAALSPRMQAAKASMIRRSHFTKMMRFVLFDPEERTFATERWCFRGSVDNWIPVSRAAPLEHAVRRFVPHLAKESFYELF